MSNSSKKRKHSESVTSLDVKSEVPQKRIKYMDKIKDSSAIQFPDSIYVTPSRNEKYFMNFAQTKFFVVAVVNADDEVLKESVEVEESVTLLSANNNEEYKMDGISAKPLRALYWFRAVEPHVIGKLQITWSCPTDSDIAPLTISVDVLERNDSNAVGDQDESKTAKDKKKQKVPKQTPQKEVM